MSDLFLGRQPIYDRNINVIGYELLYRRNSESVSADFTDADQACTQVMLDTLVEVGLENVVGENLAFINFTRPFLIGNYRLPIPHKQVVIEVLENVDVDEILVSNIAKMRSEGLTIALDDFIFREDLIPLIGHAQIIKVDILQLSKEKLAQYASIFKRKGIKVLAEKVETHEDFSLCKNLGFDYFQGYFFCKPRIVSGHYIPSNRLAIMEIIAKMNSPTVDFKDLSNIIRRDVSISYKILRLINSAYFSLPRKISAIEDALLFLGLNNLANLVTLINLSRIDDKPPELTITAMVRAKMCETLAIALGTKDTRPFFTVGLFSAIDALLDVPMEKAMELLPFSDEINNALTKGEGKLGAVLTAALAYERADWDKARLPGLEDPNAFRFAYLGALAWADGMGREIKAE